MKEQDSKSVAAKLEKLVLLAQELRRGEHFGKDAKKVLAAL